MYLLGIVYMNQQRERLDNLIFMFVMIGITIFFISDRRKIVSEILGNPTWRVGVIGISMFIAYYTFIDPIMRDRPKVEEIRVKQSIAAGLFTFLLALMAELHLTIPTFFIGFIAAYYFGA